MGTASGKGERIAAGSYRLGCLSTVRTRGGERLQVLFERRQT